MVYVWGLIKSRPQCDAQLCPQWAMIEWAKENNCTMYDFRGVSGTFHQITHMACRFKKGFSGEFTEFIGEFDIPLSPSFTLW